MKKVMQMTAAMALIAAFAGAAKADPLQGGIQENSAGTLNGGASGYGAPTMTAMPATPAPPVHRAPPLQGRTVQQAPPKPPPMQVGIQKSVELPPGFLGAWNVQGQRQKVEAMPEFQAGAEQAFAPSTMNTWNINGSAQQGYSMSNGSMSTPLFVEKVDGGTAYIRYQHQVGNTMAQEAIVMSIVPGGVQFNGLERISIVKQGLAQPRAKVTYQLMGQRGR